MGDGARGRIFVLDKNIGAKAATASERFHTLSEQMQQLESGMKTNAALKAAIVDYAKARPVFEQYKASKYSRKFLAEHEGEIALYRPARSTMQEVLTVKANIDALLGDTWQEKNKEQER